MASLSRQLRKRAPKQTIFQVESIADFQEKVMHNKKPVVVEFTATWCHPCQKLEPCIESVVSEKKGAVCLAKVNIDEHSELAMNYGVRSVPFLMVIKEGKIVARMMGLQTKETIRKFLDRSVAKK